MQKNKVIVLGRKKKVIYLKRMKSSSRHMDVDNYLGRVDNS